MRQCVNRWLLHGSTSFVTKPVIHSWAQLGAAVEWQLFYFHSWGHLKLLKEPFLLSNLLAISFFSASPLLPNHLFTSVQFPCLPFLFPFLAFAFNFSILSFICVILSAPSLLLSVYSFIIPFVQLFPHSFSCFWCFFLLYSLHILLIFFASVHPSFAFVHSVSFSRHPHFFPFNHSLLFIIPSFCASQFWLAVHPCIGFFFVLCPFIHHLFLLLNPSFHPLPLLVLVLPLVSLFLLFPFSFFSEVCSSSIYIILWKL